MSLLANPAAYRTTSSHQTRRRHSCSDGVGHTSSRSTRAALGMAAGAGLTATAILLSFYFGALTLISGWSFTVQQCRAPRIWQRLRHLAATRAMTNGLWHGKAIYPAAITARAYWCSNRSVRCRGRSRSTSVKWEAFLNARSRGPLPAHKAKRSHNSRGRYSDFLEPVRGPERRAPPREEAFASVWMRSGATLNSRPYFSERVGLGRSYRGEPCRSSSTAALVALTLEDLLR